MKKNLLRNLHLRKSYLPHAEGSCLVTMGKTQVLCVASVEEGVPPHAEKKGIGWVTGEYAMLPRAGEERSPRSRTAGGGRVQEISRLIGRSFRSVVDLAKLGPRTITIDCDVLRADGGTRTASINGGYVALVQAIQHLYKKRLITEWPLRDFIGAVSVGLCAGKPVVDMCYADDKDAEADVNLVMTGRGQLIEIQGTAEQRPFSISDLNTIIRLGARSIDRIIQSQKKILGPLPRQK